MISEPARKTLHLAFPAEVPHKLVANDKNKRTEVSKEMNKWLKDMCDTVQLHQHTVRTAAQQHEKKSGGLLTGIRTSFKMFGVGGNSSSSGKEHIAQMGAVVEDKVFDGFFELDAHSH